MALRSTRYRVGVDVGGTFTDIVLIGDKGEIALKKVSSTPQDYAEAIISGLQKLLEDTGVAPRTILEVCHGTTAATNAVLERKGAKVGLITTKGFRDVLELRRLRTPTLYDLFYTPPDPLVPRHLRLVVDERIDGRGNVIKPLDVADARRTVEELLRKGVNSIAVCLLNSYANPVHERMIEKLLRKEHPEVFLSLSYDVMPAIREYERTSTTVANAYVMPLMNTYLASLKSQLTGLGIEGPLFIMQSSGGMMTSLISKERPIFTLESGPAAGVAGGLFLSKELGLSNLITFDMGGTTTKAALIEGGEAHQTPEYEIGAPISQRSRLFRGGGYLLMVRAVDLAEVGAGGGSIISLDIGGSFRVGPQSAGAVPGPICYNQGGEEPTITDANLLLGYLNPRQLAGGAVRLNVEKAERIFTEKVVRPLGLQLQEAAYGVYLVTNATMAHAIRAVSTQRGRDIRNFVLCAFGGSGPVHAAELARSLSIRRMLIPFAPGLFSGFGLLVAPQRYEFVASLMAKTHETSFDSLQQAYRQLEQRGLKSLREEGYGAGKLSFSHNADMHYVGQFHELTIAMPSPASLAGLVEAFNKEHERTYGYVSAKEPIEITNLRVVAQQPTASQWQLPAAAIGQTLYGDQQGSRGRRSDAVKTRKAYFGREIGAVDTPVVHRHNLDITPTEGPLILDEYDTTIVVPPRCWVSRDSLWNVILEWR